MEIADIEACKSMLRRDLPNDLHVEIDAAVRSGVTGRVAAERTRAHVVAA